MSSILLAAGLALFSWPSLAAEQRSADDIINALKSPRVTRGLSTSPADAARAADESQVLSAVRNRPTRSLSTEERDKIGSRLRANARDRLVYYAVNFGLIRIASLNSAIAASKSPR